MLFLNAGEESQRRRRSSNVPLLSAALIVRDEERYIEDCLRSVRDIADEVVVVDTGSTDRTPEIARAAGARTYFVSWRDDFAAARNAALERCRGEWILYIDADERVRPLARPALERLLRKRRYAGCYVRLHPHRCHTAYWEMRLFRNHPQLRFEGVIHENIWPALNRYMAQYGGGIGYSDLVLDHEGYEIDQERKCDRNLPLLLQALETDPERVYCWYHLGRTYRELGRIGDAREALWRAIAVVRAKPWTEGQDSLAYVELVRIGLEHDDGSIGDLLAEARRRFPEQAYLVWLEGRLRLRQRRPEEAARLFEWLLRRKQDRYPDGLSYDRRLFTAWPFAGLATSLFQQGRYQESRLWFQRAEAADPSELEYRTKRQLCEHLAAGAAVPR
jgi:tetratricopeptide (TPR) repeat protein